MRRLSLATLHAAVTAASTIALGIIPAYASQDSDLTEEMQALAQTSDPKDIKTAAIDLEYDAAECAAYYNVESAAAIKSGYGNTDTGKELAKVAEIATQLTFEVATGIGMSQDAMKAQLKMNMVDIVGKLGKDYVNSPLVLQNIGMPCKALLEDPAKRLVYWLKVEQGKRGTK